jgi:hypothetical protein
MHLCISTYAPISVYHTGSQTESPVVVPKEPKEQLEVTEADEEDVEGLSECSDRRPSSFERGKPQSIFLLRFAIIN